MGAGNREKMMNKVYMAFTDGTAKYPEAGTGTVPAISYVALGLAGEAGEVADKVKKLIRDGDTPELRAAIKKEVGDVLWYWTRMCRELGIEPEAIAQENVDKLQSRKDRGVLQGSGDNR